MGWSTELFCNISFYKKTYNDKIAVEEELNEVKSSLRVAENRLRSLVFTTEPNKFCREEEDPDEYLHSSFEGWLTRYQQLSITEYKLQLLLDNWDKCHDEDGKAIQGPESLEYDDAYLRGDYIE